LNREIVHEIKIHAFPGILCRKRSGEKEIREIKGVAAVKSVKEEGDSGEKEMRQEYKKRIIIMFMYTQGNQREREIPSYSHTNRQNRIDRFYHERNAKEVDKK